MSATSASVPHKALELVFRGTEEVVAYACSICGTIFSPLSFGENKEAAVVAENTARIHCRVFCRCGVRLPPRRTLCDSCWAQDEQEREERKFEMAVKVPRELDDGFPVFWDGHLGSMGDGFFVNIGEVIDLCEESGIPLPAYVWSCYPKKFTVDADVVLIEAFQEHVEGARDQLREGAEKRLQEFLDGWCAEQGISTWYPDYRKAILLGLFERRPRT